MANTPLTISIPINAELLLRIVGSDDLHSLGMVTYQPDIEVELKGATYYQRNQ